MPQEGTKRSNKGHAHSLGARVGVSLFFIWGEGRGMSRSWAGGMA